MVLVRHRENGNATADRCLQLKFAVLSVQTVVGVSYAVSAVVLRSVIAASVARWATGVLLRALSVAKACELCSV